MQKQSVRTKFGKEDIVLESGQLAKQADGSVVVSYGETVILVNVCFSKQPKEGIDFLPLFVEYQERTYAAGRIPGGFFKREGRPSENEILTSRLIDRPLRPLFDKNLRNEIQIVAMVLSSDGSNNPDILSVIGASAAVSISGIPFPGPIGACRVGRIEGEFVLNPTYEELNNSSLDLIVVATREGIAMLEARVNQEPDDIVFEAIEFGFKNIPAIIDLQEKFAQNFKKPLLVVDSKQPGEKLDSMLDEDMKNRIRKSALLPNKDESDKARRDLVKELTETLSTDTDEAKIEASEVNALISEIQEKELRRFILEEKKRVDGRNFDEVRPISSSVSVLPRTHGSGLFTRGQTQSLAITTLGTRTDEQMIEALEGKTYRSFLLHYSFPPFSVGEVKPMRGPGRREIGHGALARKSLLAVMPSKDEFPYTIRVVSEILESNGSSSMATVCATVLSLMDAGVPIKAPVAGVALGLVKEGDKEAILTDISGGEDHFGDMDFKIAGTKNGITSMQLDLKIKGVTPDLIKRAMEQSRKARAMILDEISNTLAAPRESISDYAPQITVLQIDTSKIGELIGPGGKVIKGIISATEATIDITDDGKVMVGSQSQESMQKALDMINAVVEDPEIGKIYDGKITKITNFGAFCEILPGKEGLIHVSEIADSFVKDVNTVLKVGEEVKVKLIAIDDLGRVKLSIKKAKDDK